MLLADAFQPAAALVETFSRMFHTSILGRKTKLILYLSAYFFAFKAAAFARWSL
jgi:hypothetical protein